MAIRALVRRQRHGVEYSGMTEGQALRVAGASPLVVTVRDIDSRVASARAW